MCPSSLSFIFLLWISWIPRGLFLSGSMISVDLTEKVYLGSMISVDPRKIQTQIYDPRGSFDKMKSVDLWSHRIPDPDPWDRILGSIFGIHEHVCLKGQVQRIWPQVKSGQVGHMVTNMTHFGNHVSHGQMVTKIGHIAYPAPGWRSQPPSPWWGGGGGKMTPPLTRKLGKLEGRAIRRSTALSEAVRSHFGHLSFRWMLRSAQVIKGQIFEKWWFYQECRPLSREL